MKNLDLRLQFINNLALIPKSGTITKQNLFTYVLYLLREKVLGPKHPLTATTLHRFEKGNLYSEQGLYSKSEPLFYVLYL